MRRRPLLALPLIALLLPASAPGDRAPRIRIASIEQLPRPLPAPYDSSADANAQIDAALGRARASGKPLLIDFGANWCADCRVLAGVLELPEMRRYIARNFELVQVDIGRFDRNLDIPKRFSRNPMNAVPAVFVVDGKTGKLRNAGEELALGDARIMRPQAIADWLATWTR
ncbi:MAG: thioredoxin family protein [Pseudomonadota bacterium]